MGGITLGNPILGSSPRICYLCRHLLDPRSDLILHQREPFIGIVWSSLTPETARYLGLEEWPSAVDGRLCVRSLRKTLQLDPRFRSPHHPI